MRPALVAVLAALTLGGGCGAFLRDHPPSGTKASPAPPTAPSLPRGRVFETSFESADDFKGFYIVPQEHLKSASHALSTDIVRTGKFSHKGWVYAANKAGRFSDGNHRAYPTIQLDKLPGGGYRTPCLVDFWVWLDMPLPRGHWFSFATFSADSSDHWDRVVLLNVGSEGWPHFMHVPSHGKKDWTYQNTSVRFPMKQWVHFTVYLDFDPKDGMVKAWMNNTLVSAAHFEGGEGCLEQAHFGLYAPPSVTQGVVYNDDLVIREAVERQGFEDR